MGKGISRTRDVLQVIPKEELKNLRNLFKKDWPANVHIYNFLDTAMRWKQDKKFENYVSIYSSEGNWTDGTFVAVVELHSYDIVVYSLDKSLTRAKEALRKTKRIHWERKMIFPTLRIEFKKPVEEVKNEFSQPFLRELPSYIWWLPKEKALKYEWIIPSGYYISPLNTSHAEFLNEQWPHKHPGSENYISKLIEFNGGIGLFSEENGELCAWVVKNYFGALGILQVAENHKRKGFGLLITKIFSKKLAEDGLDCTAFTIQTNTISMNLFTKLGFENIITITRLMDF